MADYTTLQKAIDAGITNMVCLRNNSKNDDGTTAYGTGIDWFKFNGVVMSNIYSSGNSWLGLGISSEQLKINRRDTAVWYEYKETGLIGVTRFFKFRWCGYSHYSTTASNCYLAYDWFFFDNGQIFLNYYNVPTGYFTNSNNLICGSQNIGFNSSAGIACEYTFTASDPANGTGWSLSQIRPNIDAHYKTNGTAIYIISDYEVQGHDILKYAAIVPEDTNLIVSISINNGNYNIINNGAYILGLPAVDTHVILKIKLELSTQNISKSPQVTQVKLVGDKDRQILVLNVTPPNVSSAINDITINYNGLGGLKGYGGPCSAFSGTFTPTGLTWKGHQNDEEHIEMNMSAIRNLKAIIYNNTKDEEHIEMTMTAIRTLTNIHDI